jgi:hypothetical protein
MFRRIARTVMSTRHGRSKMLTLTIAVGEKGAGTHLQRSSHNKNRPHVRTARSVPARTTGREPRDAVSTEVTDLDTDEGNAAT